MKKIKMQSKQCIYNMKFCHIPDLSGACWAFWNVLVCVAVYYHLYILSFHCYQQVVCFYRCFPHYKSCMICVLQVLPSFTL